MKKLKDFINDIQNEYDKLSDQQKENAVIVFDSDKKRFENIDIKPQRKGYVIRPKIEIYLK